MRRIGSQKKAARPTRNGAVRERPRRGGFDRWDESPSFRGGPGRRQAVGAGAELPPNASQKICITRGESRNRVFAAASDFLLHRARSPRTPLISSWNRRILFFTGQRALFQDGTSFSLRFPSYFLSGARPAGMLRRPGHRKNYRLTGPLPGFVWRTAPTTE